MGFEIIFFFYKIIKGTNENEEKEDIEKKEENEDVNKKIQRNKNSLIYRFELSGYNFKTCKYNKEIPFREIEDIVIKFRNSYPVKIFDYPLNIEKLFAKESITEDQLVLVLKDLQQLLEVNPTSKLSKRKKSLKSVLHWLSYK